VRNAPTLKDFFTPAKDVSGFNGIIRASQPNIFNFTDFLSIGRIGECLPTARGNHLRRAGGSKEDHVSASQLPSHRITDHSWACRRLFDHTRTDVVGGSQRMERGRPQTYQAEGASGDVVPAGSVLSVQHLEGGIIEKIFVRDGDIVNAADTLVRLNCTSAKGQLEETEARSISLEFRLERLLAFAQGPDA
jgi:hypothetical protein